MNRKYWLLIIFIIRLNSSLFATSWDEPWHDEVVKNADSFVFAKINSFDTKKGLDITIIRTISGTKIAGSIKISNFYLLHFTSISGENDFFHFSDVNEAYFFIKKDVNGNYCIATPTTGYAIVKNGKVYATYRHSYHQALVPIDIYEETMKAIFNNYHNQSYDNAYINKYVKEHLPQGPVNINTSADIFFLQHVALECIFHLRISGYYAEIIPFLNSSNFHDQVSAIRALRAYNTVDCKNELLKIINAKSRNIFVQVMSIWTLSEFNPVELKSKLIELSENASTEDNGFGGNIMDPRIGTYIPTVKKALQDLINIL
jgi:hypothetical protein